MQRCQRIRLVNGVAIPNELNGIALYKLFTVQGQRGCVSSLNGKRKTTRDDKNDDPLH
jgi:hypothetical protein